MSCFVCHRFLRDPESLLHAMRDGFTANGGEIRTGAHTRRGDGGEAPEAGKVTLVTGASTRGALEGARAQVVSSDGGSIDAHVVVLAAGAHSAGLASQCGDPVPLDTERGYHVQWPGISAGRPGDGGEGSSQAGLLTRPVCTPEGGFIVTPMSGGVRAAGLVELGGTCAPPVPERFGQLEDYTRWMLKEDAVAALGERDRTNDWLGFRPTLPDALPVIGPSSKIPGVLYAFGHQHVGWTLGGITGRIVADLALGKQPEVDITPFAARRFDATPWWRAFRAFA